MDQKVIYLEVQYGKLVSFGIVDPSTLQWSGPPSDLADNTFTINLKTRHFALDDIYFDDGKVLVGVELFPSGGLIRTRIYGKVININLNHPIDTLKELQDDDYESLTNTPNEHTVKNGIGGLKSKSTPLVVLRSDANEKMAIRFDTDNDSTNAGQGTIPYFDNSDIDQDFPLVLSGIGYVHYTNEGYGGYLRPILKSVDMKHVV
jgi:hypothetical protein